ncbi:DedA family protein [Alicycliphilus denitrificans]|nr:DedA family protein [Alicycliphilus denitrificans]
MSNAYMTVVELIQSYGYLAVAAGTFLEGETVLLVAGAAASRGHLWLPAVVAVAALAGFAGDQLYFFLGRRHGARLLERFPSLQARTAHARALLERHDLPVILSIRFLYGLRIAGPLAMGMSGVPWLRFFLLNGAGALVWALAVASVGYGFGHALAHWLAAIDADELWALAAALLLGLAWWLVTRRRHGAIASRQRD